MKNLEKIIEDKIQKSQYDEAMGILLKEFGVTIQIDSVKFDSMEWDTEGQKRYIFTCTLKRGDKEYCFDYGSSVADSCQKVTLRDTVNKVDVLRNTWEYSKNIPNTTIKTPSNYEIFSSLITYDPETLGEFCDTHGYHDNIRNAEKIYNRVKAEYDSLSKMFTQEELNLINSIL